VVAPICHLEVLLFLGFARGGRGWWGRGRGVADERGLHEEAVEALPVCRRGMRLDCGIVVLPTSVRLSKAQPPSLSFPTRTLSPPPPCRHGPPPDTCGTARTPRPSPPAWPSPPSAAPPLPIPRPQWPATAAWPPRLQPSPPRHLPPASAPPPPPLMLVLPPPAWPPAGAAARPLSRPVPPLPPLAAPAPCPHSPCRHPNRWWWCRRRRQRKRRSWGSWRLRSALPQGLAAAHGKPTGAAPLSDPCCCCCWWWCWWCCWCW
jgi:hypothetical protein